MSTFSKGDSVLGEQCGSVAKITKETSPTASGVPCFRATADSCSPLKSLKNTASTTETPRILEEENQASLSLRADNGGEAIHKTAQKSQSVAFLEKADSSPNALSCHIEPQAKYLSSLRDFALAKSWQSTPPKPQTLESTFDTNAQKSQSVASLEKADSSMDCHAIATALARNDSKNATKQKVDKKADSRIFTQATQPAHHDSRICGGAVGALRFLGKVSELGVRAFHKNRNTAALPTQNKRSAVSLESRIA
ncbi:hypothetical protein [Helicobacter canis]|uniref:Uncharacterized protein n=1 Tax=Helicobacter canis TaxID=29419 RepID=A0A377J5L1_9HELI|nr:hypothetical protein [Helicobacter canis]STO97585.1 Uncharacterised protein [Helicobacter canis]